MARPPPVRRQVFVVSARALLRSLVAAGLAVGICCSTAVLARPSVTPPAAALESSDVAVPTGGPVLAPPTAAPAVPPPAAAPAPPAPPRALARAEHSRAPVVRESRQAFADRRGREALSSLGYPTRRLGYAIVFRPYRGRLLGTADGHTRTITVYVKQGQSPQSLRITLAHEIGHVVDFLTSTNRSRAAYLRARGLRSDLRWFPCANCNDYSSPAGDFAEVFALWLAGRGDFRSRLAGPPPAAQLAELGRRFFQPPR